MLLAEIRVAIAGVGNSASALVQGVYYYRNSKDMDFVPGLLHVNLGGYHIRDIKFVAALDVNRLKIGKDLSEAIFTEPNCCPKFIGSLPNLGVKVSPAPILDGVGPHMREIFKVYSEDEVEPVDVAEELKKTKADILINYMPVGSYEATRFYAKAAIEAGCAFINCIPEFIASDKEWASKFEMAGLPVAGDDIKSQIGATILHREIVRLFVDRGVKIDETYQLNVGGDTDFQNMTLEERLKSKRVSKTKAVTSLVPYEVPVKIGPSDYIPFLGNKKVCYIYIKGRNFGEQPVRLWITLEVFDSPNSAGVVIDVIRATKIALDRGIAGPLISVSAYAFKHPPVQVEDPIAKKWFEEFIEGKRER
ncbi:MAG: inositol-3-phosphate synthase [Candidatus Bathyarchaeia archaeon]